MLSYMLLIYGFKLLNFQQLFMNLAILLFSFTLKSLYFLNGAGQFKTYRLQLFAHLIVLYEHCFSEIMELLSFLFEFLSGFFLIFCLPLHPYLNLVVILFFELQPYVFYLSNLFLNHLSVSPLDLSLYLIYLKLTVLNQYHAVPCVENVDDVRFQAVYDDCAVFP